LTPQEREQEIRDWLASNLWGEEEWLHRSALPFLLSRVEQLEDALKQIQEDVTEDGGTRMFAKHILSTMPPEEQ
jgi:hypothetical protein